VCMAQLKTDRRRGRKGWGEAGVVALRSRKSGRIDDDFPSQRQPQTSRQRAKQTQISIATHTCRIVLAVAKVLRLFGTVDENWVINIVIPGLQITVSGAVEILGRFVACKSDKLVLPGKISTGPFITAQLLKGHG